MDESLKSGTRTAHSDDGNPALDLELSVSDAQCRAESASTLSLQLLEFKSHLLEAVEELHIRKEAETRFEDRINKLMLEKQELERETEALQLQMKTSATQHTESLSDLKQQLQDKIRLSEEEKGKNQLSAELKDKEINTLREEWKSLQLLKYNLEKKINEQEQKLVMQSRSKDRHLAQLGEVEKRFVALSRQCAAVKQAHETLGQNVEFAVGLNNKLTSENKKLENVVASLTKELEEVNNKRIKAQMTSVKHDRPHIHTGKEQEIQMLQQKLTTETEMNKKLQADNAALRAEKQEVMKALQKTHHLLLTQTQTLRRVELELQAQNEQYQALKQEHEVMRDKSKALDERSAQLMESCTASRRSWDSEKEMLLNSVKTERRELESLKETYDQLHQKHTLVLSSLVQEQAEKIVELEMKTSHQSTSSVINIPDRQRDPGVTSEFIHTDSSQPEPNLPLNSGNTASELKCDQEFTTGHVALNGEGEEENEEKCEKLQLDSEGQEESHREEEQKNEDEESMKDKEFREEVNEEENAEVTNGIPQKIDTANRPEENQGSAAKDSGDTRSTERQTTTDREEEGEDEMERAEERRQTAVHTPETQILTQTTTDCCEEKSNRLQVVDSKDAGPPLVSENLDGPERPCQSFCEQNTVSDGTDKISVTGFTSEVLQPLIPEKDRDVISAERQTEVNVSEELRTSEQTPQSKDPSGVTVILKQMDKMCLKQPNQSPPAQSSPQASEDQQSTDQGQCEGFSRECNSNTVTPENQDLTSTDKDVVTDAVDKKSEEKSRNLQGESKEDKTGDKEETKTGHSAGLRSSLDPSQGRHHLVQTLSSCGNVRATFSQTAVFPRSKKFKVPLVITTRSDVMDSLPSTRHQQGEWRADMEKRAARSRTSFPLSATVSTVSGLSGSKVTGCSKAPASAVTPVSDTDRKTSCSQEREERQASFQAQISKIEQFLIMEGLQMSKRQKTEK